MEKIPSRSQMRSFLEQFGNEEPETQKELRFINISTIKKSALPIEKYVEKHTKDEDIVIGGSSAIYSQMKKFRKPHDLDVYTNHVLRLKNDVIQILRQKYHNVTSGNIQMRDGHRIVQIYINGKQAVDIHHSLKTGTLIHVYNDEIHYDFKSQDPLRIGKMRYLRVGTILVMKVKAINENYHNSSPLTGVRERVNKDVSDYHKISKSLSRGRTLKSQPKNVPVGNFMDMDFSIGAPIKGKKKSGFMGLF